MFFRYPGGKSRLLKQIRDADLLPLFPQELNLLSPFCGAAHLELAIRSGKALHLNDGNPAIFCLWDSISESPGELIGKVKIFKPTVQKFQQYKDELSRLYSPPSTREDVVKIGFRKLVLHQCSYSGLGEMGGPLGGTSQSSQYKIDCRWNAQTLTSGIQKAHELVKDSIITNKDFRKFIKDEDDSFFFIDPPYYEQGAVLYRTSFTKQDHEDLAPILRGLNTPFVLSYDDHPWVRSKYTWAHIYELKRTYKIGKNAKEVIELLITNRKI